jgi:hypothetical protein
MDAHVFHRERGPDEAMTAIAAVPRAWSGN